MSVELQRLNTSKVANVGVKAKVWPASSTVAWCGCRERRRWVLEKHKPRRGRCMLLYFDRDPDQDHECTSEEAA
jgi:hypothetical protein